MNCLLSGTVLLAQQGAPAGLEFLQFAPFVLIAVMFYFMMLRPQQRERQIRESMLKALKKNDRVVTIAGILGTVANLTPDGKEVMVKVDDNVKLRMLRSSIQAVITDPAGTDSPAAPS